MKKREIKVTMEIGDNLRKVLMQILEELHRYPGPRDTNEGLRMMVSLVEKLLEKRAIPEIRQGQGYYDSDWRSEEF